MHNPLPSVSPVSSSIKYNSKDVHTEHYQELLKFSNRKKKWVRDLNTLPQRRGADVGRIATAAVTTCPTLDGWQHGHVPSRRSGQGTSEIQMWARLFPAEAVSWRVDLCLHVHVASPRVCTSVSKFITVSAAKKLSDTGLCLTSPTLMTLMPSSAKTPYFQGSWKFQRGHIPTQQRWQTGMCKDAPHH